MPEDDIIGELEELSQMVEGGEDIEKGLQEIEKITKEVAEEPKSTEEKKEEKKEEKEEKSAEKVVAGAAAAKKVSEEAKEQKEEKKKEEREEKKAEKPDVSSQTPNIAPEKAIKHGNGFKYASALLIVVGLGIYALAYYLRWHGWHLISYPPSSLVALGGTVLILAGGEVYYRGKER